MSTAITNNNSSEQTAAATTPNEFNCPITQTIMKDPVVAADGHSYERAAIEHWFETKHTSPMTNEPISTALITNYALRHAIEAWLAEQQGSTMSIDPPADPPSPEPSSQVLGLEISTVKLNETTALVNATAVPPEDGPRKPAVVVCLIDVSGSMGSDASLSTGAEADGFSRLDLVKHSVKTIINVLGKDDLLGVVSFSDSGKVELPLIKMDENGRKRAQEATDRLDTIASTNIWDGLRVALKLLSDKGKSVIDKNCAILLLTDGESNLNPPRGVIPTLGSFLDDHPLEAVIHTFGFGYNLDSNLLVEIAKIGCGLFGFIPDSSMVGTVFVNALSNILATCFKNGHLSLDAGSVSLGKSHYSFGPICYGQTRSVIQAVSTSAIPRVDGCIKYNRSMEAMATSTATENPLIFIEYARLLLIEAIHAALQSNDLGHGQSVIAEAALKIKQLPSAAAQEKLIIGYLKDLEGEVKAAVSRQDWYDRWGKHYLLSLSRAHELQMCHNFKDPGVQGYGGKLFKEIQTVADKVFCNLPAPVPSARTAMPPPACPTASFMRSAPGAPMMAMAMAAPCPAPPPVSMRSYYDASGPCFDGDAMVSLLNGTTKKVRDLIKGDILSNGSRVMCLVKTPLVTKVDAVCIGSLILSKWHPIKHNDTWVFPCNVAPTTQVSIDAWFNIVLDSIHCMTVSGVQVVTLGHGMTEGILRHGYYGTRKVVQDLMEMQGWSEGLVVVGGVYRSTETGLVCQVASIPSEPIIVG